MTDCMSFPKEPMEFIKGYSFVDSDEVYTKGSELVPLFRVEQMLEHYLNPLKDKQEQGLLIELKVPLGTRIWYLVEDYHEGTVEISTTFYDFRWLYCHKDEEFYLTHSEADEALANMGGK